MSNNICGIYKIENTVDGKIYIGQSKEVQKRFRAHITGLNRNGHRNNYLQHAWNKYGEAKFSFSVIEECSKEELNQIETFWINFYQSDDIRIGYNCNKGGDSRDLSESTKKRISDAHKGKKKSPEHAEKIRNRVVTEESKKRMSESHKGKPRPWRKGMKLNYTPEGLKVRSDIAKSKVGEKNPLTKITEDVAKKIITMINENKYTAKYIASTLDVSISIVKNIKKGSTWSHISGYPKYVPPIRQKAKR